MFTRTYTDVTQETVEDEIFLIQADGGTVERQDQPNGTIMLTATFSGDPPVMTASEFPWMPIARGELGIHEGINRASASAIISRQPNWASSSLTRCLGVLRS